MDRQTGGCVGKDPAEASPCQCPLWAEGTLRRCLWLQAKDGPAWVRESHSSFWPGVLSFREQGAATWSI